MIIIFDVIIYFGISALVYEFFGFSFSQQILFQCIPRCGIICWQYFSVAFVFCAWVFWSFFSTCVVICCAFVPVGHCRYHQVLAYCHRICSAKQTAVICRSIQITLYSSGSSDMVKKPKKVTGPVCRTVRKLIHCECGKKKRR